MASKSELVHFLDSRVFDPILQARKSDYKEADQKDLADVQRSTESEKKRFHAYRSAVEIRENYLSDLHSDTAKRINRELQKLELPRLPDVKDEFLQLAGTGTQATRKRSSGKTRSAGG